MSLFRNRHEHSVLHKLNEQPCRAPAPSGSRRVYTEALTALSDFRQTLPLIVYILCGYTV